MRSFGTAFLTVIFPLYLAALGYRATKIGVILTAGSILGAVLVAAVGILGDRIGRRPMLIALGVVGTVGALALAGSSNVAVVVLATGLGGVGRGGGAGSGGAWGPYLPAEQPLIAASAPPGQATAAFGRLGFVGVLSAAAGSLVASLPPVLHHAGLSTIGAYRAIFLFGAVASLAVVAVSFKVKEERPAPRPPKGSEGEAAASAPAGLSTRQLLGRLGFTNALNGLGFGFLGPLLTYWFYVRFGVGAAGLGILYTVINLISALPFLGAAKLVRRLGAVNAVAITRALSVIALIAMALAGDFLLAAILLASRTALNSLGLPARQSYAMAVADERRRSSVAAFSSLPAMGTSSISPAIGGALMGVFVDAPIVGAAIFMGANTIAYFFAFRKAPPPDEAGRTKEAAASPAVSLQPSRALSG